MKIKVKDTLGIVDAEIEITPGRVTEVVGPNASGKTSITVCAQAVLARDVNPLRLSVADVKRAYPHDGSEDAQVDLITPDLNEVRWYPVNGRMHGDGDDPMSHPVAVGLIDFAVQRTSKDRVAALQEIMLPPHDEIMSAVQERLAMYMNERDLAGVIKTLGERGWEATASLFAERALEAKRAWCDITGRRQWGVKIAADWRPDGWLADYDLMTVPEAESRVTDARDALNALHRVSAVSEADAARAQAAAEALPDLRSALRQAEAALDDEQAELTAIPVEASKRDIEAAEQALADAQRELQEQQRCPHCSTALVIRAGEIVAAEGPEAIRHRISGMEARLADKRSEYADLVAKAEPVRVSVDMLRSRVNERAQALRDAERDAERGGQVQTEADRIALAGAEQDVERAHEVVRLVSAQTRATELNDTVLRYTEIAQALGKDGVRSKLIEKGNTKLNKGLAIISSASGWPLVECDPNGALTVGGRPSQLCSESEQWRGQASMQLTLAAMSGSRVVVLDRGDMLDEANRAGLDRAVERVMKPTNIAVLLCSTGLVGDATGDDARPWSVVEIQDGRTH